MLLPRTSSRQVRQEALRHARRNRHVHQRQRRLTRQKPRHPTRRKLQIEAVQATQLQETIQHTQRPGSKTIPRRGTHPVGRSKHLTEHREIQGHPARTKRSGLLHERGHHKLHHPVGSFGGAAHDIQREPGRTPRHERQQGNHTALTIVSRHQNRGLIRRIINAVQGHREAALHTTVPPRLNIVLNLLLLILVELGVAANLHAVPAATHALNGLTHREHRGVIESESIGLEHRLLTHLKHAQPRATISTSPSLTDAQSRRNPTVAAGLQHPTFDDVLPSARITHRVAGSQAHRTHRAVSDGRPAIGRENHLLVAASREVGEGIVRAVVLQ